MTMLFDVFRELFKMFVADLRLTLARLACVALVALLLDTGAVAAMTAGVLLTGLCIAVLLGSVIREAVRRRKQHLGHATRQSLMCSFLRTPIGCRQMRSTFHDADYQRSARPLLAQEDDAET